MLHLCYSIFQMLWRHCYATFKANKMIFIFYLTFSEDVVITVLFLGNLRIWYLFYLAQKKIPPQKGGLNIHTDVLT